MKPLPLFALALCSLTSLCFAEDLPQVKVTSVRRIFSNGEHNAFTDLCQYHGALYLTFRSCPEGHMVHPSAYVLVMRSQDQGATWQEAERFSVPDRDTRDPHFLVFHDKLFVYSGTWYSGPQTIPKSEYDLNKMLGFAVWTEDGQKWNGPTMLEGTFGFYIWRSATFGGKAYLSGRRKPGFEITARGEGEEVEDLMLESDDGLIFRKCSVFQDRGGDETAFRFDSDGSVLAIVRHADNGNATLANSKPPYATWERTDLGRSVGGPLLVKWGEHLLVGGRRITKEEGPKMVLSWLTGGQLHDFAVLPSGGDNSYPGFAELSPTHALISYYSSHEQDAAGKPLTAIYMADLAIESH